MILAIIAKEDQEGIVGNLEEITQVGIFFKSEVQYIIDDLVSSGLILRGKIISKGIGSLIQETKAEEAKEVKEFIVTESGLNILINKKKELEQKWTEVKQFRKSHDKYRLNSSVNAIRKWIPFMLYSGVMDTKDLQSVMRSMGADISALQISDLHNTLDDLGIDPPLLAAGLIFASPVAGMLAVIAYLLASFRLRTLDKVTGDKYGSAACVGVKES